MLIIERGINQRFYLGRSLDDILAGNFIRVVVIRYKPNGQTALGIEASKDVVVLRENVFLAMCRDAGREESVSMEKPSGSICECPVCGSVQGD